MVKETDQKVAPKMVREQDLMAQKKAKEKAQEELATRDKRIAQLEHELKVAKTDAEDEDAVLAIKETLNNQYGEFQKDLAKYQEDLAAFNEEKKASGLTALASKYQVEIDTIREAEDPEKEALRIYAERLAGEKKEETPSAENVVESASAGGIIKKMPLEMTNEEFSNYEAQQKAEYYKKK